MYTESYDILTFLIYIFVGLVCSGLINRFRITNYGLIAENPYVDRTKKSMQSLVLLVLFLTLFAALRKIDINIGGADAINYQQSFLNALSSEFEIEDLWTSEFLFTIFTKAIRFFTKSTRVYFFICYGFIAIAYMVFINKFITSNLCTIPMILLVFPYLKSFCTLKTGMAVAVFLLGVVELEKRKRLGILLILSTFFIHRMSIIFIPFVIYKFLYERFFERIGKVKWGLLCIVFIVLSYIVSQRLKMFVIASEFLNSTDMYYITHAIETSIWSRWPMYIAQLTLLIALFLFRNRIPDNDRKSELIEFCTYDFIVLPASLVFGFWRANEYFYIARLLSWGMVIPAIESYFTPNSKKIIRCASVIIFVSWLIYRVYSECFELKIMPYVLSFF